MDAPRLTLYVGRDCHLCDVAREQLQRLSDELAFELDEVDITGVEELEARHRRWLPVLEVDGRRLSVYRIDEDELRQVLAER
jgi:glutaredoxin